MKQFFSHLCCESQFREREQGDLPLRIKFGENCWCFEMFKCHFGVKISQSLLWYKVYTQICKYKVLERPIFNLCNTVWYIHTTIIIIWWSTICFFVCLRRMIRIKWSTICSPTGIRWSQQCWEGQRRSPTAAEDRKWKYNILHFHFLSIHSNPDVEMASVGLRLPPRMPASNNSKGRRWTEDTPRPSFLNFRQNKQNNKHKY